MDRNIRACWWGARSVTLDTVFPSALPFDIMWPRFLQEFFCVPEILLPVLSGCVDANLVEYLNHVVERHRTFGFICRLIPGKGMNQYTKQYSKCIESISVPEFYEIVLWRLVRAHITSVIRRHRCTRDSCPVEPALFFCISGPTTAYFRIWTAIFACEIAHSSWIFRFAWI